MRIPSASTDKYIYFIAYDANDYKTKETGLSSFTVYRSRNNGAATAMTTPTISEISSSNMPGLYSLLVDEDTTINSTSDTEELALYITHSGMDPVTRVVELYRPKISEGNDINYVLGSGWIEESGTLKYIANQVNDVYHANIDYVADTNDEYTVIWFKNGNMVQNNCVSGYIHVIEREDGTDLVAQVLMDQNDNYDGIFTHNELSDKMISKQSYIVAVEALIDNEVRSFAKILHKQ